MRILSLQAVDWISGAVSASLSLLRKIAFPAETGVGHGLWFHDPGDIEQIGPNPRHPYQQRPVTAVQPQTSRRLPQCDVELMAYKEVLGSETPSRLEYVADKRREQVQDGNHRI